jgi:Leucine-rich repeat (LRR) protein
MSILEYFRLGSTEIIYRYLDGEEFKKVNINNINSISTPENIHSLHFHSCQFSEISSRMNFELFYKVEVLSFENIIFGEISNYSFFEKFKNIKKLSFINCDIKYLNNFIENNSINLEYLKLDKCEHIELINIGNLTNLIELHINNNNKLTSINNELSLLKKIKILNLRKNALLDVTGLANLTELESLDLGENSIKNIEWIEKLTLLKYLYIDYNNIKEVWSKPLLNLKYFIANFNRIDKIKILESSPEIEVIELKGNQLRHLPNLSKMTNINYNRFQVDWNDIIDIEGMKGFGVLKCMIQGLLRNNKN